jgi:hypothetical protein
LGGIDEGDAEVLGFFVILEYFAYLLLRLYGENRENDYFSHRGLRNGQEPKRF